MSDFNDFNGHLNERLNVRWAKHIKRLVNQALQPVLLLFKEL